MRLQRSSPPNRQLAPANSRQHRDDGGGLLGRGTTDAKDAKDATFFWFVHADVLVVPNGIVKRIGPETTKERGGTARELFGGIEKCGAETVILAVVHLAERGGDFHLVVGSLRFPVPVFLD